jgi:hypothetical protein
MAYGAVTTMACLFFLSTFVHAESETQDYQHHDLVFPKYAKLHYKRLFEQSLQRLLDTQKVMRCGAMNLGFGLVHRPVKRVCLLGAYFYTVNIASIDSK